MIDPDSGLPPFARQGFQAPAKTGAPKPAAPEHPSDEDVHFGDESKVVEELPNTQPGEEFLD